MLSSSARVKDNASCYFRFIIVVVNVLLLNDNAKENSVILIEVKNEKLSEDGFEIESKIHSLFLRLVLIHVLLSRDVLLIRNLCFALLYCLPSMRCKPSCHVTSTVTPDCGTPRVTWEHHVS